jgi:hypothetical protein
MSPNECWAGTPELCPYRLNPSAGGSLRAYLCLPHAVRYVERSILYAFKSYHRHSFNGNTYYDNAKFRRKLIFPTPHILYISDAEVF